MAAHVHCRRWIGEVGAMPMLNDVSGDCGAASRRQESTTTCQLFTPPKSLARVRQYAAYNL